MADVAARAGVSGQTVSRVVNASPRVDPATRARVEAAMADLGYRPHRAARALRTGRTQTIGLVVSTLASVGNSRMLQAVADAAASRGYALTVVTLGAGTDAAPAFERLSEQGVDGVIVLNEATALALDAPAPRGLSIVAVDAPLTRGGGSKVASDAGAGSAGVGSAGVGSAGVGSAGVGQADTGPAGAGPSGTRAAAARDAGSGPGLGRRGGVQSDHAGGARAATDHLLALGHRAILHLAGPIGSFAAEERERGWREALVGARLPAPEPLRGDWTAASGHRALLALADRHVTAVFAANDQMALGAIRALTDAGHDVPGAVSVVGFDDIADAADYRPPLTTVRQDFDRLGELAVATLVAGIEDGDPGFELVPTTLVVRASTAVPR
ncbi:LacI family DNA-binding transcriptional regulator [Microbacterium allomyrinae]|uniref:Substrate-binding domain-containing protein n=1 Tax=Microbacterium allomyrinae TaxID=2830666 RepID=A0A9X1LTQ6_9MICO|nr:LacI family DNA-binding transcriptional regulator [Microbacterium allomyrinae]MCC2031637.1 substrate-binding domain-containing protein [Microbacterium allomyrinae]